MLGGQRRRPPTTSEARLLPPPTALAALLSARSLRRQKTQGRAPCRPATIPARYIHVPRIAALFFLLVSNLTKHGSWRRLPNGADKAGHRRASLRLPRSAARCREIQPTVAQILPIYTAWSRFLSGTPLVAPSLPLRSESYQSSMASLEIRL